MQSKEKFVAHKHQHASTCRDVPVTGQYKS